MRFATIPSVLVLLLRARLAVAAPETFNIPLDLRSLELLDDNEALIDDGLEPWEDNFAVAPPGVKVPGNNPLYLCGKDDSEDVLKVKNVDFSPATPARGAELVVSAKGDVTKTVQKGTTVRVQVRFAGSKVIDKRYDLCEGLERFGHQCPFPPGAVDVAKGFTIPNKLPRGHYSMRINVNSAEGKQLTCFTMNMKL